MPCTERELLGKGDGEDGFLSHLPLNTPVFRYNPRQCSMDSLIDLVLSTSITECCYDQFAVIEGISPTVISAFEDHLPGRVDYLSPLHTLILKMPSHPHEEAASRFEFLVLERARQMKVVRRILCLAATRIKSDQRDKEADRAWKPRLQRAEYPTVLLEVGISDTAAKLERDIGWWLDSTGGRAKLGITIDIKPTSGNIYIKSWVPAYCHPRQVGARNVNQHHPPQCTQIIKIKKGAKGQKPVVQGGHLVIPFRDLLLTEPGEGEHDFVFTGETLLYDVADPVWEAIEHACK